MTTEEVRGYIDKNSHLIPQEVATNLYVLAETSPNEAFMRLVEAVPAYRKRRGGRKSCGYDNETRTR